MKRSSFFIIALCAVHFILGEARHVKSIEKLKYNCLIRNLKTLNMIDNDYPEYNTVNGTDNCETVFNEAIEGVYTNVVGALRRKDFYKYKVCMMDVMRARRYAENTLKQAVFIRSEVMSQEEIGLKVNSIIRRNKNVVQEAMKLCMYSDMFGKLFDKLISVSSDEEGDKISNYCMKKYVVESKLIDTKMYKVSSEPENPDIQNVNCNDHLLALRDELLESVEEALDSDAKDEITSDCARQRFLNPVFVDKLLEVQVLGKLNITESQKLVERKRFVDFIEKLIKSVVNCG